ncbi:MAG: acylneuraminate cytidylyltransferase family protein [Phycisphaerae bacterium]
MRALGVILARAGSKGLPGKCVWPLNGRPMIEYTFDHALASSLLSAIVLTTDSTAAAALAGARGVEVIERPAVLATDTARVDRAAAHAAETWESAHREHVDYVAILYGNIPVRAAGLIDRALRHLAQCEASSVRSLAAVTKQHPDWLHSLVGDRMRPFRPNQIHRRQDLEPLYYHDGAVVAVTRAALLAGAATDNPHAFLGDDRRGIVQSPHDAVDVDTLFDVRVAEALLARPAEASA